MKKKFRIEEVDPSSIKGIEKNARFMNQTEFNVLVDNIRRDGQLSSVPFCTHIDGELVVVSGNHRVKASIEAGLSNIDIMIADDLSNDQIRAIQLSHNSIVGQDDLSILKELFDEIQDNDFKEYSYIDTEIFEELEKIEVDVVQPQNEFVTLSMIFFSEELSKFEEIVKEVELSMKSNDDVIPMPLKEFDNFIEVVGKIKKEYSIKDYGATIMKMAELARASLQK